MLKEVHMPKLSPKSDEYFFGTWQKQPGDAVKQGDILFEVETDKVISEVQSQEDGILKAQLVDEGAATKVGDLVATIEVNEE
ncbi:lipoyl domain-containing protein [Agrilactobacillus fermenti]|uniref:lipoyl domain-containing protein n=1 Tax=Agrilactobacillus fermenti TaxID=2586909 RepID=UPI001E5892F9|nr:lipoyl domain-containing protein [Agrilactobacillus fermenti]MCD2257054.1 biotin-requiring enzyme [Agrilactobacillus fermenti]